ncbi:MAG TPA: 7-cyano-7-deazaguanine synthase [Pirellulales bacterium]
MTSSPTDSPVPAASASPDSLPRDERSVGLLLSGGLDSTILLYHLLSQGRIVHPLFVRSHLHWEEAERRAVGRILADAAQTAAPGALAPLTEFDNPLQDVYGRHWSTTGRHVPDAESPDEAVYLPGRNPLLLVKAAVWCQLHRIDELALAPLGTNPFPDATPTFFDQFQQAINTAVNGRLRIVRPFGELTKEEVMELGRDRPLELTFSCIDPQHDQHCGACNKCAERRAAFQSVNRPDPTKYVHAAANETV